MIPTIIYLLLRRYRRTHPEKADRLAIILDKTSKFILLSVLLILACLFALPQNKQMTYSIKRKGNEIGIMSFSQQFSGTKTWLKIESQIKTRFLLSITARAMEEAVYENGIMLSSFIYQNLNGNERVNKKTKLEGNSYVVTRGTRSEIVDSYPIYFNLICLYGREPLHISKVYSDKFQRFLTIETLADHHYKIVFPDGNYNEYHYTNGLCSKVEVHHSLYRSSFELKNK